MSVKTLAEIKDVQSRQKDGERTAKVILSFLVNTLEAEDALKKLIDFQTHLVVVSFVPEGE